ncbi:MAG TPA: hypothetical protein VF828_00465 [Patescibacteria group bacterium]
MLTAEQSKQAPSAAEKINAEIRRLESSRYQSNCFIGCRFAVNCDFESLLIPPECPVSREVADLRGQLARTFLR